MYPSSRTSAKSRAVVRASSAVIGACAHAEKDDNKNAMGPNNRITAMLLYYF
ncbi:MAG: hypothetical protein AAFW68_10175 [Pseudomonadota bacterium]